MELTTVLVLYTLFLLQDQYTSGTTSSSENWQLQDRVQYRPGDILIGAAMQVSHENQDGICVEEYVGIQLVEVMNIIIDEVNANDKILNGVKLGTIMIDTCSSEAHALQKTITEILPLVLSGLNCTKCKRQALLSGVVGASYSSVSMQLARILQVFQIPQVSYWSTSVELSDKNRFPYFFRSVASDIHQVHALISFVKQRQWNYISVVYDDDSYGVDGYSELARMADMNDICIAYSRPIDKGIGDDSSEDVIQDLVSKRNARVVVLFTVTVTAEKILWAAKRIPGGDSLIWIGVDGWTGQLPRDPSNGEYLDILDGALGFVPKLDAPRNFRQHMLNLTLEKNYGDNLSRNPWFSNHISNQNNCSLPNDNSENADGSRRRCDLTESIDPSDFRIYETRLKPMSDAVYAFVHALDKYHKVKCKGKAIFCEELKQLIGTTTLASELYQYLKDVNFTGIGGRNFTFDDNHDGPPTYDILTYSNSRPHGTDENLLGGWSKVGTFVDNELSWYVPLSENIISSNSSCSEPCKTGEALIPGSVKCCWFCQKCSSQEYVLNGTKCESCLPGYVPNEEVDGCIPLPERELEYNSPHSIFMISLGTFGLLCTGIVTVIFIIYRDTAIVRASGKELCFFVLMGIFVTLLNCFTVTMYPSRTSCIITRVILAIGPSCMYVGLLMKTIRVVFIFQSKRIMKTKIKRYLQPMEFTLLTTGVAAIQILILITWFLVANPSVAEFVLDDHVFHACDILIHGKILFGLVYPFLIIIICTVLATINRNVPTGFRETLFIGFTMYTTCVIWLSFVPIFTTNSSDIPLKLTTVSAALSFSALTVLICLFAPRCHVILFNPTMNTAESVMSRRTPQSSTIAHEISARPQVEGQTTDATVATQITPERTNNGKFATVT